MHQQFFKHWWNSAGIKTTWDCITHDRSNVLMLNILEHHSHWDRSISRKGGGHKLIPFILRKKTWQSHFQHCKIQQWQKPILIHNAAHCTMQLLRFWAPILVNCVITVKSNENWTITSVNWSMVLFLIAPFSTRLIYPIVRHQYLQLTFQLNVLTTLT